MFPKGAFGCLVLTFMAVGQLTSADQEIVTAEVFVDAPGCSRGAPEGKLQIKNLLDDLYLRFEVKARFENPVGAPTSCDGSCLGEDCECDITLGTKLEVPPGTTRSKTCFFCSSGGCQGCFNESGDCLTEDMFCSEESNDDEYFCTDVIDSQLSVEVKEFSCDGGSTWTSLGSNPAVWTGTFTEVKHPSQDATACCPAGGTCT